MTGSVEVGIELPEQVYRVTRADLVRYAGASGDFNPIHWSDRTATKVGLPGVIAHGMFTMALVGRAVTVPDDDEGTEIEVAAVVREVTEDGLTRLDITATCLGEKVLSQARATVRTTR